MEHGSTGKILVKHVAKHHGNSQRGVVQAGEGPHDCGVLTLKTEVASPPSAAGNAVSAAVEAELVAVVRAPSMACCYWHGSLQHPRAMILRSSSGVQDHPAHIGTGTKWVA